MTLDETNSRKVEAPYVPISSTLPELTIKAVLLGLFMAVILSVANAYLGLKAGMTISAVFPAAVVAMTIFRFPFLRGNILEENLARTTASVGEALVAGAIFTIPAFLMVEMNGQPLWEGFRYWEVTVLVLAGGLLGILFVVLLRRTLAIDMGLPYPEGYACFEMVKAGQKESGSSGAKSLFGALAVGGFLKLLLTSRGIPLMKEVIEVAVGFPKAVVTYLGGTKVSYAGGTALATPAASPALMAVGYIIGPRYAAINFSGGILAWLFLIPLILFIDPEFPARLGMAPTAEGWKEMSVGVWLSVVRPIAVGTMLVASFYTLYGMKDSIIRGFRSLMGAKKSSTETTSRIEKDLAPRSIGALTAVSFLLVLGIYYYFTKSVGGTIVAALVMIVTSFVFSAVGGYLVGLVGNSNQPVSGLTLSGLVIAALVMLGIGMKGSIGVAAVLGVATVVCCSACMAGDMIQDLKVGHLLGGTPWKMEVAEIISVLVTSFFIVVPMWLIHETSGIGGAEFPAPQAGLMAMMSKGIIGGEMPWMLILIGIFFAFFLITIGAPSPMLIAVGMYLPFDTSAAIFVGGVMKWLLDRYLARAQVEAPVKKAVGNRGILVASGFIAGEAICGVLLAGLALIGVKTLAGDIPWVQTVYANAGGWLSLIVFALVGMGLIWVPLKRSS